MNVEGAAFEPIHREVEVTPEMVEAAMTIFREEGISDTSDDEMRAVMARAFPVCAKCYQNVRSQLLRIRAALPNVTNRLEDII